METINDRDVKRIAFMGTGLMGGPMAMRLLAAGHKLTVWNRTAEKTRALSTQGAEVAETPSEAASGADLVVTMLSDGPAVGEILFEKNVVGALRAGAIVVDMSSIPPATARDHAARLSARGIGHLDAPVSGGTKGAAEGTLAIMAGGTQAVFDAAYDVLSVLGRPTRVGPSGSGQLAKLANQAIVAVTIGAVAEALLLAAAGGADPAKVRDALGGGFADSIILKQHGQRMLDRNFVPGGPARLQAKDLRTILGEASALKLDLPLAKRVAELYESALEAGFGNCDHSALLLEIERRNSGARVGAKPDRRPPP